MRLSRREFLAQLGGATLLPLFLPSLSQVSDGVSMSFSSLLTI
jgi:hypothetical protein